MIYTTPHSTIRIHLIDTVMPCEGPPHSAVDKQQLVTAVDLTYKQHVYIHTVRFVTDPAACVTSLKLSLSSMCTVLQLIG